jgi:hypothetical protein
MSYGVIALRAQNAVILRGFPAHPSAHETERMDGAQPLKVREIKTAMSYGVIALRAKCAVILRGFSAHPSAHETERMDGAQPLKSA